MREPFDAVNRFDAFAQEHLLSKNLEFCFVTLDSWDLRVQLPREARDKAVVLPPYLQHSRTFDLHTGYQRWQTHHPESLPFGPSSLANICAALEVEPVQSSAPNQTQSSLSPAGTSSRLPPPCHGGSHHPGPSLAGPYSQISTSA